MIGFVESSCFAPVVTQKTIFTSGGESEIHDLLSQNWDYRQFLVRVGSCDFRGSPVTLPETRSTKSQEITPTILLKGGGCFKKLGWNVRAGNQQYDRSQRHRAAQPQPNISRKGAKAQRGKENSLIVWLASLLLCSLAPLRETFLQKQELANLLRRGRADAEDAEKPSCTTLTYFHYPYANQDLPNARCAGQKLL